MTREFAVWADPSTPAKSRREQALRNPFAGALADLRQIAVGWRWGRAKAVPLSLPPVESRAVEARPPEHKPRRLLSILETLTGRSRPTVTGAEEAAGPVVAVAHLASDDDRSALEEALPETWHVVTASDRALAAGKSVLYLTDAETPLAADVLAEAARAAARYSRPLVAVVVRRLHPPRIAARVAKGPAPQAPDEVFVRFAPAIRSDNAVQIARQARDALAGLLAEDDATWWSVQAAGGVQPVEHVAPWRLAWQRSAASSRADRKPIWR